jgi:hypothetical protein
LMTRSCPVGPAGHLTDLASFPPAFSPAGRGAFSGGQQRDLPDAPRGPAATRAGRQPKESSTPTQAQQDKSRPKEKEDKKTLSEWKWGLVPERERERDDEAEGSGGRKRKAEGGDDGQSLPPRRHTLGAGMLPTDVSRPPSLCLQMMDLPHLPPAHRAPRRSSSGARTS